MKRHVPAQVKGVCSSVGGYVPALGESRRDLGRRRESREAVEDIPDRAAGGDVRRQSGIERARIIVVARIDERAAIGCAVAEARAEPDGEDENQPTAHGA